MTLKQFANNLVSVCHDTSSGCPAREMGIPYRKEHLIRPYCPFEINLCSSVTADDWEGWWRDWLAKLPEKKPSDFFDYPVEQDGCQKDDADKLRMDLIPAEWVTEIAKVLTAGAGKYKPEGWRTLPGGERRFMSAAMRHLMEAKDCMDRGLSGFHMSDDNLATLVQAAVNCLIVFSLQKKEG